VDQQRLAVREYGEAMRLRPRDASTKRRLRDARALLERLEGALRPAKPAPLRRFLAHYNLSLRYWDMGKAREALAEARRACDELQRAGLDCGCAGHNLALMGQVQGCHGAERRRLQEALRSQPRSQRTSYELGILLFDMRMMHRAEEQLKAARELARAASCQTLVDYDRLKQQQACAEAPILCSLEGRRANRMAKLLEDLEDDLEVIGSLRGLWCVEDGPGVAEELQATRVRDGPRPHLLPCMYKRYSQDHSECERWWAEISRSVDLGAAEPAAEFKPPQRRRSLSMPGRSSSAPGVARAAA